MNPLAPPPVITFGIGIFVPTLRELRGQALTVHCQVLWTGSVNFDVTCAAPPRPIFEQTAMMTTEPLAFLFQTDSPLPAGKYDIRLSARGASALQGARSFVMPRSRPNLVIGFPYSVYSPITLS